MESGTRRTLFLVMAALVATDATRGPIVAPAADDNTYTLQRGDTLTLNCSGVGNLTWSRQRFASHDEGGFAVAVHGVADTETAGEAEPTSYVALQLSDVNEYAVGYYACHRHDTPVHMGDLIQEPADTESATYIYIYVNGTNGKFARHRSILIVPENSKFVVPCRPTMPQEKINLSDLSSQGPEQQWSSERYTFNPKIGYVIESSVVENSSIIMFKCISSNDQLYLTITAGELDRPEVELPTRESIYGFRDDRMLVGEDLVMNCTVDKGKTSLQLVWFFNGTRMDPNTRPLNGRYTEDNNIMKTVEYGSKYYKSFTLTSVKETDAGSYVCTAMSHIGNMSSDPVNIKVLAKPFLKLTTSTSLHQDIVSKKKIRPNWIFSLPNAYPLPNITIFKDESELNLTEEKYSFKPMFKVNPNHFHVKFGITNMNMNDSGIYTFVATNRYFTKNITVSTTFQEEPTVNTNTKTSRILRGLKSSHQCYVTGNPLPNTYWTFQSDCHNTDNCPLEYLPHDISKENLYALTSTVSLNVQDSGNLTCYANNTIISYKKTYTEEASQVIKIEVSEVEGGFAVTDNSGANDNHYFARDHDVWLYCTASRYDYRAINGFYRIDNGNRIEIDSVVDDTALSYARKLHIPNAEVSDSGTYECDAVYKDGSIITANGSITVEEWEGPEFLAGNSLENGERQAKENLELNLNCTVKGVPLPSIHWFHDNVELLPESNASYSVSTSRRGRTVRLSSLLLRAVQEQDVGRYECRARGGGGAEVASFVDVVIARGGVHKAIYLSIIAAIVAVALVLITYLLWKVRKEKRYAKTLYLQFHEGNTRGLNPELAVDEQADLLPYDKQYEFPADKLQLMEILGAGAFGEVYKAMARGIKDAEEVTVVAVKKVKRDAEPLYRDALTKELKIMCHIGRHLNVLNLLGACTKKIARRELLVIVEYCKFGNIHDYMHKHREVFIDNLTEGHLNGGFACSIAGSEDQSDYSGIERVTGITTVNCASTTGELTSSMRTATKYGSQVELLEFVKGSDSDYVKPKWSSNYGSDYNDAANLRPLCSRDLLSWAFQIACGMEYLASRKVLHGDLAARNILLAEGNVVKICDFGLARTMQTNDVYQKRSDLPVPVKWLALECLRWKTFSTQSDVWSYGVVLWELFSMGQTPYPHHTPEELTSQLSAGYRLQRPRYANAPLYDVMLECWDKKPAMRPSFTMLQQRLGQMLDDSVRNLLVNMNSPYEESNEKRWRADGVQDYLQAVGAPDYRPGASVSTPTPTPHYQNSCFFQQPTTDAEGYLQMNTNAQQASYRAPATSCELAPMLSPPPTIPEEDDVFDAAEVVRQRARNFRNAAAAPTAVENPSYHILELEKKPDHGYLNIIPNDALVN